MTSGAARPTVVLALSPIAEQHLDALLFDSDAPFDVLASALEADELLKTIQARQPEAVLLSPGLSGLSPAHCERARTAGARLVGVALDEHERYALDALEVERKIDPSASRQELLAAIQGEATSDTTTTQPTAVRAPEVSCERGEREGSLVAVIGSKGAPGASECAASLAALAAGVWETMLLELDALGGSLPLRLGANPNQGSILGLIRATQAGEGALRELIERWRCERQGWPDVLLGPPDPNALSEFTQPGTITRALEALTRVYQLVVCDVGFLLAENQPLAHIHREALINADAVLLVLGASEQQLRAGLRQLDTILGPLAIPAERLRIVLNGAGGPASAEKDTINGTLAEHLTESGLTVDAWLGWDAPGAKQARRHCLPIALAHRRSGYTRELAALLDELFLPNTNGAAPKTKHRKRRLAAPSLRRRTPPYEHEQEEVALPWQT